MRRFQFIAFFAIIITSSTSLASADVIRIDYTGTVNAVSGGVAPTFSNGNQLSGKLFYDSATAPRSGGSSTASAFDAVISHEFILFSGATQIYSAEMSHTPLGSPELQVDNNLAGNDRFGGLSRVADGLTGADVNGFELLSMGFRLDDSTQNVFSTASVLPMSMSLSQFDSDGFFLFFDNFNESVTGDITSISFTTVPEPISSIGIVGFVLFTFSRRTRR